MRLHRSRHRAKPSASFLNSIVVACILLLGHAQSFCAPEYRGVTILHTNDTHGHLIPFSFPYEPGSEAGYASMPHIADIGGIARRATLARQIRYETRGNTLLLDAGDALDGTPFSIQYMGEADFAAMSAAGYDAMTPGNHEFSASVEEFRRNVRIASFPIFSANIVDRETGRLELPQYGVFDVQGARIAVFGLTVANKYRAAKEGFDFLDPIQAAKDLVPELKKQADIVIALTHLGVEEDQKLAREVPGIDVIVGGHSHSRLAEPILVRHTEEPHAFWVGGTVIVQDYWWGGELGRLDLRLRRNDGPFTLMSYSGRLIPVTSDIPDDPATARVVELYYKPISKLYGRVVGQASDSFINHEERENPVLNLICDALREAGKTDVAIYNRGGVRGDIVKGEIKVWDIATVLPFRNKVVQTTLTGRQLREIVEAEAHGVSGMTYRMSGGKIVEAKVGGKPLDDDASYTVATIDFLARNFPVAQEQVKVLSDDYRQAIIAYIEARETISPVLDGRMVIE